MSSGKRHLALHKEGSDAPRREDKFYVDESQPFGHLSCVIMASGLSRRFGSNKLMTPFRGEPLIARALDATQGIFISRVVVTRHEDVAAFCRERGVGVILHDLPERSDTIRLGLEAVGESDGCLFLVGDQPLLRRETVASLALCAADAPQFIWRAAHEGTPASPVLFPKWAYPQLLSLPAGAGGSHVIRQYPERVRYLSVRDARELMDVDTPEELRKLSEADG